MKAKWHRYKHGWGYEHVLFVGVWEWRVSAIPDWNILGLQSAFGFVPRWRATGPGLEGSSSATILTKTLPQAKARCKDGALSMVEAAAADIGMKLVADDLNGASRASVGSRR